MITKVVQDQQLYVYHNGKLIYKRWLETGQSLVFETYGQPWSPKRPSTKGAHVTQTNLQ